MHGLSNQLIAIIFGKIVNTNLRKDNYKNEFLNTIAYEAMFYNRIPS